MDGNEKASMMCSNVAPGYTHTDPSDPIIADTETSSHDGSDLDRENSGSVDILSLHPSILALAQTAACTLEGYRAGDL